MMYFLVLLNQLDILMNRVQILIITILSYNVINVIKRSVNDQVKFDIHEVIISAIWT